MSLGLEKGREVDYGYCLVFGQSSCVQRCSLVERNVDGCGLLLVSYPYFRFFRLMVSEILLVRRHGSKACTPGSNNRS